MGMSSTTPTPKKTGRPTMKATNMSVQWRRFSPKAAMNVCAMTSAPPDSARSLPSMVPRPTTTAMKPSVPPTPS